MLLYGNYLFLHAFDVSVIFTTSTQLRMKSYNKIFKDDRYELSVALLFINQCLFLEMDV